MAGEIGQKEVDKVLDNAKDGKIDAIDAVEAGHIAEVLRKAAPVTIENFFNDKTCSPRNRENLQCIMEALAGWTDDHKESLGDVQKTLAEIAKTTGTVIPEEVAQKVKPTASATENGGTGGGNALVGGTENAAGGSGSASATNAIDAAQPGIEHAAPDSLQGMINGLNDILPKSLKMVDVTPEKLREQALTKLETLIRGRLSVDKQLLKIKNNEKRLAIIDAIVTNVTDQMKQGNRTDNFIMSSMYLSTEMLKQKNNAYANKEKKNDQTFNIGMLKEIGQTLQSSDDIIKFAMSGNLNSGIDSKLNTIADKVQTLLPSKFSIAMGDAADIREKVQKEEFTQGMAELFAAGSNLDFNTIPASLATMNTMMGNHVDVSKFKNEPGDLTKLTKDNIETVLATLPTNDLEKAAAKGEILEARFGKGTFGFVLDFLKQHGLMDMAMAIAKAFGFGDQIDTLSLPKERRELKIATDAYFKAKTGTDKNHLDAKTDLSNTNLGDATNAILTSLHVVALHKTLGDAQKFLKIDMKDMDAPALKQQYKDYINLISEPTAWKQPRSFKIAGKPEQTVSYAYNELFTSEKAIADNFIMYLKTKKMPQDYDDANTYLAGVIRPKETETADQKKAREDKEKTDADAATKLAAASQKEVPATISSSTPEKKGGSIIDNTDGSYTYIVKNGGSAETILKLVANNKHIDPKLLQVRDKQTKYGKGQEVIVEKKQTAEAANIAKNAPAKTTETPVVAPATAPDTKKSTEQKTETPATAMK